MSKDKFFNIVNNAITSWDFRGQTEEQVYNGMLESITQDGIKIEGITPPSQIAADKLKADKKSETSSDSDSDSDSIKKKKVPKKKSTKKMGKLPQKNIKKQKE